MGEGSSRGREIGPSDLLEPSPIGRRQSRAG